MRFTAAADRDPLGNLPELFDTNRDGTLLVTRSGTATAFSKQTIDGDVDLIADIRDKMNAAFGPITNPYKVGYYVKSLFMNTHGVKIASTPYMLATFDDDRFNGTTTGTPTSALAGVMYNKSRPAVLSVPHRDRFNHYIVTKTKGASGSIDTVDAGQYWNTNTFDDNAADTVAHANFSGKQDSGMNTIARFKDGEYEIHIVMSDVAGHDKDETAGRVRVVNFIRTAATALGGQASAGGAVVPLRNPNGTVRRGDTSRP